jgi:transposase
MGIDLGKHGFHVHGQDRHGKSLLRRKFDRKHLITFLANFQPCTIVMEACAGAHWMARQLSALGHEAKLISPQFVRPIVKGNKNDFIDAEAICEAASRPSMRFVTPKTEAQQCLSALHRTRESLMRDWVKAINQIHGFLLEFGIGLPKGPAIIRRLPARLANLIETLRAHIKYLDEQLDDIEKELGTQLQEDDLGQRLMAIPGVGPITASVLSAEMGDGKQYGWGGDFAASPGLVPQQHSTGGRANLLGISKRGDKNIRRLLAQWVRSMLTRRHSNVVACALANKLACTAWAMADHQSEYRMQEAATPL